MLCLGVQHKPSWSKDNCYMLLHSIVYCYKSSTEIHYPQSLGPLEVIGYEKCFLECLQRTAGTTATKVHAIKNILYKI